MDNMERIRRELETAGYSTRVVEWPQGKMIAFNYQLECGSRAGEMVQVGVSNPDGEYPEYPPHWLHVSPPIDDGKGGSKTAYQEADGTKWLAMSRPPSDIWDRLPTKHMIPYIEQHVRRIWKDI